MAVDVVMPRLSDSMEEGTIVRWLKQPGDAVARGDELAEIETDKATMPCEADIDGTLVAILVEEGATAPLGAVIARIGDPSEMNGDAAVPAAASAPAPAAPSAPAPAFTAVGGATTAVNGASGARGVRAKASPVARRLAARYGVELSALRGTGPRGRIVKADVEAAAGPGAASAPAAPGASTPSASPSVDTGKGKAVREPLSRLQQTIARRMAEAKSTQPEFVLRTEVDMEETIALRGRLREIAASGDRPVPSYNDFIVRACAVALREFPRANAAYKDGSFERYSRVNVGIAVAGPDALLVPTIFDADTKSLGEIARTTKTLAERGRTGALTPPELSSGTFTVSNLGMFGVTSFTAVLNPPQAAILAVGALAARPVVHEGAIVARRRMDLSLTCDHRILYGADAAAFLARIRELLEQPLAVAL
jgi:pyruvate dehydrogenase E2 component (dihydrolipoamide acetyltransferase)